MGSRVRVRYLVEAGLAMVAALLALVTLVWKQWIELVLGVDPDGGSGALEYGITFALLLVAGIAAALARNERRRALPVA
jgi:hypothetical protein